MRAGRRRAGRGGGGARHLRTSARRDTWCARDAGAQDTAGVARGASAPRHGVAPAARGTRRGLGGGILLGPASPMRQEQKRFGEL
jgi:hypothetical protein